MSSVVDPNEGSEDIGRRGMGLTSERRGKGDAHNHERQYFNIGRANGSSSIHLVFSA
jgi:hypothetical protein